MRHALVGLFALLMLLVGQVAWADNPIDEYSSHRPVRMLDDLAVCLSEHACSVATDCQEITDYEWNMSTYTMPMMAAGASGCTWQHYQSAFVFQEHVDCMRICVDEINTLCSHLLAAPPNNWLILPSALETVEDIQDEVEDLHEELDNIQYWLDQTFIHRDYQQIQVAAWEIEEIEAELHLLIGELARLTGTVLTGI